MPSPTRASEFPNDNPLVSEGAVWVCPEVRGSARHWTRPRFALSADPRLLTVENARLAFTPVPPAAAEPPFEPVPAEVVWIDVEPSIELPFGPSIASCPAPPLEASVETQMASADASDAFSDFVAAVVDVLVSRGATRAAACAPALLGAEPLRAGTLGSELEKTLAARGILTPNGRKSDDFERTSEAWRRVLKGESDDLSSCGTTTLDTFGAELVCALLGLPKARLDGVRRDLRRRGVAAFGMVSQAA